MKRLALLILCMSLAVPAAAAPRAITFDDLIAMGRIGDFDVSPDGKRVAFDVTWFDKEANDSRTDIYLVSIDGGDVWKFVRGDGDDHSPRWSPDGRSLAFVSDRDGSSQIWIIPADGGEARRVTDVPTGAGGPLWSPDGTRIVFTSNVFPGCPDMDCNAAKLEEAREGKVRARVIDGLLYRHWNGWREGRRSRLFVAGIEGGAPVPVNGGETDVPPISLGGERDYDFSPDGREICFTMNPDPVVAVSTNNDIWIKSLPDGEPVDITADNPANDNNPRYSPDGRYIAWRSMARAGFEADRQRLVVWDRRTRTRRILTEDFDYSISNFDWTPDSRSIWFTTEDRGRSSIGRVDVAGGLAELVVRGGFDTSLRVAPKGGHVVFARQSIREPIDLWRVDMRGRGLARLTDLNRETLDLLEMNPVEEFSYEGANKREIHGMLVKPPFFEEGAAYPLVLLIHGGPQGSFGDDFHYRWNAQMFASPGYVVAMLNPTGSTGYGQELTDGVSGDWGGAPYVDIMKGVDFLVETRDFIDGDRLAAAGASYGGYMVDWIEGHTDRFSCLVSHAGVYNLESMYGATEELWFPEWEFQGTPWTNPEMYERFSPHNYAADFRTPCLVVHGEHDYRVPYTEGLQFFTALQRRGVPSKLLFFPDEDLSLIHI